MDNRKDNILDYYRRVLKEKDRETDMPKVEYIIGGMDEGETFILCEKITAYEAEKSAERRMMTYYNALVREKDNPEAAMQMSMDCIGNYDFTKEHSVKINGSTFTYEEGFPVEDYREELEAFAQANEKDTYTILLEEGKLVIY